MSAKLAYFVVVVVVDIAKVRIFANDANLKL